MRSDWGESKEERFDFLDWDEGVASRISARVNRRPFVLPQADVSTFTGREEELEKLKALAIDSQGEKQCSIVSVAGTGGIGKSALACRFAKQYRDHFPDGVIGLRVDGKDTETIAREFAREMGVVLEDEEEQGLDAGTIMRELFASRKMLLIFDNADEASIKKLRPGGNICAIIITTRDRNLSFALDIPHEGTIDLPLLPKPESLLLLQRILGEERVNNELDAAYEIIRLVGNLPLALQISGANLKGKTRHLSDYAAYLRKKRADLKVRGNKDLNLQASLAISLESLEKDELDFFACLSVCAEDGFSRKTATIAGDCEDEWEAQDYLDSLYQLSLINEMETGENRFAFHPLIREFALKLAKSGSVYKKAAQRHAEYFINWIQSNSENLRIVASQIAEDIDDLILVGEWLRNTKIVNYDFIESLHEFFEEYGYWKKAAELMRNFQEFAKQSKDWEFVVVFCTRQAKYLSLQEKFEEAKGICKVIPEILENIESETVRKRSHVKFLIRLGRILEYQEDFHEAIEQLQLAVSIARDMDEPDSLRNALRVLGWVAKKQGEVDKAIESFQEEIQLNEILNHQQGIAITLNCIGGLLQQQERFDEALSTFQRSIEVSEAINDQREIAIALNCIGGLLQKQEKYDEALSAFERQIEVSEAINDQKQILIALNCMGGLLQQQGKYDEALSVFKREIEIDEAINNQQRIAIALNRMGGLLQQQGKYDEALSAFKREIEVDEAINNQQGIAIALNRMGGLLQQQGKYDESLSAFKREIE
ncbi:MAG: tetratricopeptide repeat protein, partial [Cyanobacteria bacterium P01_E01_bin.42]